MASQTQNVANAIVQQFFPIFLENCGFYAFYMFAGICWSLAAFVWFCIPETRGKALEEMEELFVSKERRRRLKEDRELGDVLGVFGGDARRLETRDGAKQPEADISRVASIDSTAYAKMRMDIGSRASATPSMGKKSVKSCGETTISTLKGGDER